ncbi:MULTISPECIES: hypothetical protein [Streptomyces]|nr:MULTISPECIES: hypothetical protein [Streptomyces]
MELLLHEDARQTRTPRCGAEVLKEEPQIEGMVGGGGRRDVHET